MNELVYEKLKRDIESGRGSRYFEHKKYKNGIIRARKDNGRVFYSILAGATVSDDMLAKLNSTESKSMGCKALIKSMHLDESGVSTENSVETLFLADICNVLYPKSEGYYESYSPNWLNRLKKSIVDCANNIPLYDLLEVSLPDNNKLLGWFWEGDSYYKGVIEESPYDFHRVHKDVFAKFELKNDNVDILALMNSDFEAVCLAGSKASTNVALADGAKVDMHGDSSDMRNFSSRNGYYAYDTFLADYDNSCWRRVTFNTIGLKTLKSVRTKLGMKAVAKELKSNSGSKHLAEFNRLFNDASNGMKYNCYRSLAFLRRYDSNFKTVYYNNSDAGLYLKLLVNETYRVCYILAGSKLAKNELLESCKKYNRNTFMTIKTLGKVFLHDCCSSGLYVVNDSPAYTFEEVDWLVGESNIVEKCVSIDLHKVSRKDLNASLAKNKDELEKVEESIKKLEAKRVEIETDLADLAKSKQKLVEQAEMLNNLTKVI